MKAWNKPEKIEKFYLALKERECISNTVIALKTCIVLQDYFFRGPLEVILGDHGATSIAILREIQMSWEKILIGRSMEDSVKYFNLISLGFSSL